jgi:hypothetical protein
LKSRDFLFQILQIHILMLKCRSHPVDFVVGRRCALLSPSAGLFPNIGHGVEKLTGRYDLGVGPFRRKILQVAGHDVVGARGLGALQKNIIIGVGTGMYLLGRLDPKPILPNSAECGLD